MIHGRRLVIALEGADVPLGWFNLDDPEPCWHALQPHVVHGRTYPIRALLSHDQDLIVIAGDSIWRYRNLGTADSYQLLCKAKAALNGYKVISTAITQRHFGVLLSHVGPRIKNQRSVHEFINTSEPELFCNELLFLFDTDTLQELGSAANAQRALRSKNAEYGTWWTKIENKKTELVVYMADSSMRGFMLEKVGHLWPGQAAHRTFRR